VYADGSSTILYDSGLIVSTAQNATIPSGRLPTGVPYDLVVHCVDTSPLDGYSVITNFTLSVPPPASPTNFAGLAVKIGYDSFATAFRFSWDQSAYSEPQFVKYCIRRKASGGPDTSEILLAEIESAGIVNFVDYTPASDYVYTYSLSQVVDVGSGEQESARVTVDLTLTLAGTVIVDVNNPSTYRTCLLNVTDRAHTRKHDETVYALQNSEQPVTVRGKLNYWEGSYKAFLIDDTIASGQQRAAQFEDLDTNATVVCVRDGRQRKRFMRIADLDIIDKMPSYYEASFKLREEKASEGV
jgi:hypothetical protein